MPVTRCNLLSCLVFSLLIGAGCTTVAPGEPAAGGFNLRGKLGVVQGDDSFSARFVWQQRGRRFTIDLWGPFGQGRLRLIGNERRLELREGDGSLISRGPADTVMRRRLGWSLPLSALPQWVRGRPAAGIPVADETYDADGRLSGFRQLDWLVDLDRFRPVTGPGGEAVTGDAGAADAGTGTVLPYRVTATRDQYRVRLAISRWQLAAPAVAEPLASSVRNRASSR